MSDEDKLPSVKTVLIVEDDQDIGSFILRAILYETSYQAIHVTDGYQALETVNTVIPNLLLVDYHLPRMNGIELFDRLHTRKELEHVPVIMISARLPKEEARKRKITCLEKPFELDILLKTIDNLIE
ncbi:MAG: response regulator [Chloroflexi bacterium]|nr:MAG: response regulator [Chloroflexota bacterium]